jgi:hypothetical protein
MPTFLFGCILRGKTGAISGVDVNKVFSFSPAVKQSCGLVRKTTKSSYLFASIDISVHRGKVGEVFRCETLKIVSYGVVSFTGSGMSDIK